MQLSWALHSSNEDWVVRHNLWVAPRSARWDWKNDLLVFDQKPNIWHSYDKVNTNIDLITRNIEFKSWELVIYFNSEHVWRVMFHPACHILREALTNCCVFAFWRKGSCLAYLSVSYSTKNNTLYSVKAWSMLAEWMSEWMIIKPWHSMYEYKRWFWRRTSEI